MAQLINKDRAKYFEFLVDSGSDFTLISQYNAEYLGLFYNKIIAPVKKVEVANSTFIHAKQTLITIKIADMDLKIPIFITKEHVDCLLGRKGVFEYFDILFQELIFPRKEG